MCPPAAEVAQMRAAHDLDGLIAVFQEKLGLVRQLTRLNLAAGATRQALVPPSAGHLDSFTGPSAYGSERGKKPVMPVMAPSAAVAADLATSDDAAVDHRSNTPPKKKERRRPVVDLKPGQVQCDPAEFLDWLTLHVRSYAPGESWTAHSLTEAYKKSHPMHVGFTT